MRIKRILKKWSRPIIFVSSICIALIITMFIGVDFTSLDIFKPANKRGDFKLTDTYNSVVKNNGKEPISDKVVIVSIDEYNRAQTIDIIKKVVSLEPNAIGLDFAFADPTSCREELLATVLFNRNIVSAIEIVQDSTRSYFNKKPMSFYEEELPDVHTGFVNLDIDNSWNVVRTFHLFVNDSVGDTIPSMVLELAKLANPIAAKQLLARHNTTELIDFVTYKVEVIPSSKLNNDTIASRIKDKTVLIGDTAYLSDIRITPLREPMGGIYIHAYALQTVLEGTYIKESPRWVNWLIGFIFSIGFLLILQCLKRITGPEWFKDSFNWLIRVFQFIIMYALVQLGCFIFTHHHTYVDFTPVISLMLFSSLCFDLGYALRAAIRCIRSSIIRSKRKRLHNKQKKSKK